MTARNSNVGRGFGDLRFTHLIDALPVDQPAAQATWLLALVRRKAGQPVNQWPIHPRLVDGLALELAANSAKRGQPLSQALLELLAECLGLGSSRLLADPQAFYSGERFTDARHAEARSIAELLDFVHWDETGDLLPWETLRKKIKATLQWAPDRQQLRDWRARYAPQLGIKPRQRLDA